MISAGSHFGSFWIAGGTEPPEPVQGVLTVAADGTSTLEVQTELTNWHIEVSREHRDDGIVATVSRMRREDEVEELTIHGDLPEADERVTLLFARSMGQGQRIGGRVHDPGWERFSCRWAVVGAHLDGPAAEFGAVRFRTAHMDEWASITRFADLMRAGANNGISPVLGHIPSDVPTATGADGVRLNLSWHLAVAGLDQSTVTTTSETFLEVNLPGDGLDWERMRSRVVSPLVAYLSLAIGEEVRVLGCEVADETGHWCTVVARGLLGVDLGRTRSSHRMLAPLGVLSLEGLAAVIQPATVKRMGPLPIVLAQYQNGGSATIETEALELSTIAEGVHARLFDKERRLSHSVADNARRAAVAAVPEGEVSVAVREALAHLGEMTYSQRLGSLVDDVAEIAPAVTGPPQLRPTWIKAVTSTRNEFAHRPVNRGFLIEGDVDRYLLVTESLQWLLKIAVLRHVALVAPEALTTRLTRLQAYNFAKDRIERRLQQLHAEGYA